MEVADASTGGEHVAATSSSPGSGSIVAAVLAVVTVATLIAALIPKSENAAMGTEVQFEIAEQDAVSNLYQLAISPWWPAHRLRWILGPPAAPVAVVNRVAASRGHQLRDQRLLVARQDGR